MTLSIRDTSTELDEIVTALGPAAHRLAGRTVLMTGGSGFLGRHFQAVFGHLNAHVLEKPCRLLSVDNHITGRAHEDDDAPGMGIVRIHRDIIAPVEIDEPIDFILHAAGIASPYYYRKFPLETLEVATTGTRNILELARAKQVESFVFFSSSEIYGDPDARHVPTPESFRGNVGCLGPRACYDESKRLGETLCYIYHGMHGVNARIIRPFNVYGPGMQARDYRVLPNFASRILSGKPLHVYGQGTQTRTFCYVSDAMAGFLKVLLHGVPGEAYNIGNPSPEISMLDLAKMLEEIVGRHLPVDLIEYPDAYPPDEPMRRCPDLTKSRVQLGYEPTVELRDGLSRFMAWARLHYAGTD